MARIVLHSSAINRPKAKSRTSRKVSGRQRLLLLALALLFAFVLPFICWGTVATPGHPHQTSHFVFSVPSVSAQQLLAATINKPRDAIKRLAVACGLLADPSGGTDEAAGRSTPDTTSVISLILLVFLGALTFLRALPRSRKRTIDSVDPEEVDLPVPTPPPRTP